MWHYKKNGQSVGPIPPEVMKQLASSGEVTKKTRVWEEKRKNERRPFLKPVRYYLSAPHSEKPKKIYRYGDSVDISKGGLGMITDYPLTKGNILFFLDKIEIDNIMAKSAVVRWTRETENNRYRIGLEFRR